MTAGTTGPGGAAGEQAELAGVPARTRCSQESREKAAGKDAVRWLYRLHGSEGWRRQAPAARRLCSRDSRQWFRSG